MKRKRPIIFSHERSGTHFLMNTISLNFDYISSPWIDFDWVVNPFAQENTKQGFKTLLTDTDLNIVKSHHEAGFFDEFIDFLVNEFQVFYIYRDEQGVMNSFCKHLNELKWDAGPKCENGNGLGWTEPFGALMRYQKKQYANMRARHAAHVKGWRSWPDEIKRKIIYVRYEDLNKNFDGAVRKIAKQLGENLVGIRRPSKTINVITPDEDSLRAEMGSFR